MGTFLNAPVLMLNGRYDSDFPPETSQNPMFDALGTAPADKKHVIFEMGHEALPRPEGVRLTLDWLDRYLGSARK